MQRREIQRVRVWPASVRLVHWTMALSVLALLLTGWAPDSGGELPSAAQDAHFFSGYVLLAALLWRIGLLLFARGTAHWRDCIPSGAQTRAALQTMQSYLTLGRVPLPRWYAHNPWWGPVYLLWFGLLLGQLASGLFLAFGPLEPHTASALHVAGAKLLAIFCAVHLVAVVFHELKGSGSDVSAMISGYRVFVPTPPLSQPQIEIPLRDLQRRGPSRGAAVRS